MIFRRLVRRWRRKQDLAEEIQSHVEHAVQYYVDRGLSPDEARRTARIRFGNPRAHREGVDDMSRLPLLDMFGRDLRYACRSLGKARAFAVTVILTLAVTIGAAGAVFSLADAILLRPLPFPEPDRLSVLGVKRVSPNGITTGPAVDGAMWATARDNASLVDMAVSFRGAQGVNLVTGNTPSFVRNQLVGAGYFRVVGVQPSQGREFTPEEAQPGGPAVAVVSHGFWQRVLGGRPDALGSTIHLRGESFSVIGIMPEGFEGVIAADVWTPLRSVGQGLNYTAIARPKDGVSLGAANAQLASLGDAPFTMLRPAAAGVSRSLVLLNLHDTLVSTARAPIVMLGWGIAAVLLIACVNIMALLLARGGTRAKEIATRMALGSGRAAVIRQLMVESLVLAIAGGACGLLIASVGLEGLKSVGGTTFVEWQRATLDLRAIVASFALAGVMSLLFGVMPAWQTSRIDVHRALTDAGSRSIAGGSRHILRRLLVISEVAMGVVVLVAAGLLVRQFMQLRSLDPGFSPTDLYSVNASLQDARYRDPAAVNRLFTASIDRLRRSPGIEAASVSQGLPYQQLLNVPFTIEGQPEDKTKPLIANVGYVTGGFVETLGMTVARGRAIADRDTAGALPVAMVNDAFVRFYFPQDSALNRRIRVYTGTRQLEIVGIVRDVQQAGAGFFLTGMQPGPLTTSPTIYVPAAQADAELFGWMAPVWTVRAASANDAAAAFTRAIGEADPLLPIGSVRSLETLAANAIAQPRLLMALVGALALAALLLAAIGIHGLITHVVAERRREFGIRLALGATPGQTVRAVAGSGMTLALLGVIAGLGIAIPGTRAIESFLYTVAPSDPATFGAVGVTLITIACISSLLPARRILTLDPARILRD